MYIVKSHSTSLVKQDFLYKYRKSINVPNFLKLSLSAKFSSENKEAILSLFEVLLFNKAFLSQSKVNSLSLNLRKGDLVGCKIVLKKESIFEFLDRFLFEVLGLSKNFNGFKMKENFIYWQIKDIFVLEETNLIFMYLQSASTLDIVINSDNANFNFFQSCRFPIEFALK